MSRSKYVSVGATGGLILDSKYDDFATNAGLQSVKNEIVSAIEAGNVNTTARQKLYPASNLQFEMIPDRSMMVIAIDFKNDGFSYGIDHGWIARSDDGWESKTNGARHTTGYGWITRFCVWSDGTFVALTNQGNIIRFDDIDLSNLRETLNTDGRVSNTINISFWEDGINRIVLVGDYEQNTSYAPKLYLSLDGGDTFNVILEGKTGSVNNHWHATCYDKFSGTIWASQGDGGSATTYYSADLGKTWEEASNTVPGRPSYAQPTLILPFPDRVVFGRDGAGIPPGLDQWVRGEKKTPSEIKLPSPAFEFRTEHGSHVFYPMLGNACIVNGKPHEAYLTFPRQVSDELSYIFATGDGGESWHMVYAGASELWVAGNNGEFLFLKQGTNLYRSRLIEWV